jgi:hypothetical protein
VYPVDRVKLDQFFSPEQIAKSKARMRGWVEVLARTGQ